MAHRGLSWVVVVGVVFAGAFAMGGCTRTSEEAAGSSSDRPSPARATAAVEATARAGHKARYVGPVAHRYDYADPGITMATPPSGSRPDISWRKAFGACFTGPVQCVRIGDAVVTLATVTGPGNAGTAAFKGRHMLEKTLVYVVTWAPTDCRSLGRTASAGAACRVVNLITAKDVNRLSAGAPVYAFVIPTTSPVPGG